MTDSHYLINEVILRVKVILLLTSRSKVQNLKIPSLVRRVNGFASDMVFDQMDSIRVVSLRKRTFINSMPLICQIVMINLEHFLIDLQQGAYLDAAINIPPELAKETGFKRFIAALYLYYMAILFLSGGVLARLFGPLHLDFLKLQYSRGPYLIFFTDNF